MNMLGPVDTYGAFATAGAEAGPLGCIAGLLLDLVVSFSLVIAIAFLLWLGMNVITTGVLILFLPVYILFRRSLRAAIVKGRTCHGQVMKSLGYAAWTTFISMSWLYVVIYLGHVVHEWMK